MSDYYLDGDRTPEAETPARSGGAPAAVGRGRSVAVLLVVTGVLAGFGGIVWYAYSNARSVPATGEPPLIRADTRPVRIRPEQPGGIEVPYQDRLVLQELNPDHEDAVVEQILPPPEDPLPRPEPTVKAEPVEPQSPPPDTRPSGGDLRISADPSLSQPSPASTEVESPLASVPVPQRPPAVHPGPAPAMDADPQPVPSPTPPPAPATTAGGYRVQMASVRSAGAAKTEWQRLQRQHSGLLGALQLHVQEIDLGGEKGVYYRVQAGPLSEAEAGSVCAGLKAQNADCIIVSP